MGKTIDRGDFSDDSLSFGFSNFFSDCEVPASTIFATFFF